jgi:hypothetical protein
VAAHCWRIGVIESAAVGLADRGSRRGYDYCFSSHAAVSPVY